MFLFVFILSLSVFFRVVNLHADVPTENFIEAGDEGTHSYAARQLFLTGNWSPDGVYFGGMMPVYPFLQVVGVFILGVHNYAFRSINVLASLAAILLLFWFLKNEVGKLPAFVGLLSFGLSFFFAIYSKTGLPEATMIMFSLCAFIAHYFALKYPEQPLQKGLVTGTFLMLAFFTKQSSVSVLGLVGVTTIVLFIREYRNTGKLWNRYARYAFGVGMMTTLVLIMYLMLCVLPAWEKWLTNVPGTWGGNRPRKALLQLPYLMEQIRFTTTNPLWMYLHGVTVGVAVFLVLFIHKALSIRQKVNLTLLETLCATWFVILLLYLVIIPLKGARFFIPIIIPMTIMYASLFGTKNRLYITGRIGKTVLYFLFGIVVFELVLNIGYGCWYFVHDVQFQTLESTRKLERYVSKDTLANLPVHWIINDRFRNINTFLVPVTDQAINLYYRRYGWPEYMVILNRQIPLYQRGAPRFFKQLRFVTVINGYTLYKVKRP